MIFIPSSYPPHKKKEGILAPHLRAEMVRLAVSDNPRFTLSEVELDRPGKSIPSRPSSIFAASRGPGPTSILSSDWMPSWRSPDGRNMPPSSGSAILWS
jgi:hypothetical protein